MKYIYKRVGILLGIILIFSLLITTTVYAEITEYNINNENVELKTPGEYRINGGGTETNNNILIGDGNTGSGDFIIYINNVKSTAAPGIKIYDDLTNNVTIILEGENQFKPSSEGEGIRKKGNEDSGLLTIKGDGNLIIDAKGCPGIGANGYTSNILIEGGNLDITAGNYSAAIGSRRDIAKNITITGGNIKALGWGGGAGIGGGDGQIGENINISGGTVIATGGSGGAGIGGGINSIGRNIEISGGNITATGSKYVWYGGAGIGGGAESSSYNIIISGGTINAIGGNGDNTGGAGIGSGGIGDGGNTISDNITISGGTINATAGEGGNYGSVGIGGKYADNIIITGGVVTAKGNRNKPGIGSYGDDTILQGTTTINGNAVVTTEGGVEDTNVDHIKGVYIPKYEIEPEAPKQIIRGNVTLNENTTLPENLEIILEEGSSLTISEGKNLTIPNGTTLRNKGTIKVYSEDQIVKTGTGKLIQDGGQLQTIEGESPIQSTITLSYSNDIIGGQLTGGGTFDNGSEITVVATEYRGYKFLNWTKNGETISDKKYKFTVENDVELVANYENRNECEINLSVEPKDKGNIEVLRPNSSPYYEGENIILKATPKKYYRFLKWEKTVDSETSDINEPRYSFVLESDVSFKAIFEYIKKEIDFEALEAVNGQANTETTTELNLTLKPNSEGNSNFQIRPENISIQLEGASIKENTKLTSLGENKFKLEIDNVKVIEGEKVKVKLSSDKYNFTPSEKEVSIHVKDIDVNVTNIVANGEDDNTTTTELTIDLDKEIDTENLEVTVSNLTVSELSINGTQLTVPVSGITENNQNVTVNISKPGYKFIIGSPNVIVYKSPIKYLINISSNNETYGSVEGGGLIVKGTETTVKAIANNGYKFVNWTENNEEVSAEKDFTFTVEGDRTLVANFRALEKYTLTLNPTEGGNLEIIEPTEGTYFEDSTVKVKATENTGYEFSGWYDGETLKSEEKDYEFTITQNTTLTGKFKKLDEVVNVKSITPNGGSNTETTTELVIILDKEVSSENLTVTVSNLTVGEIETSGKKVTVSISGITENNQNVTVNISKPGYNFIIESSNIKVYKAPDKYNVNISIDPTEGGSVDGAENREYTSGTNLNLEAIPNTGYAFSKWMENGESLGTENILNITVNKDRNITAKFEVIGNINYYEITATSSPTNGGTILNAGTYGEGSTITLKAIPNDGYHFKEWKENGVKIEDAEASYTFNVTEARTLVAIFEEDAPVQHTITLNASPTEGGEVIGGGTFTENKNITLKATPKEGYTFKEWQENGVKVEGAEASYTFYVTEDRILTAVFEKIEEEEPIVEEKFTITAAADPSEGGVILGAGEFKKDKEITLSAIANENYNFVKWTENGAEISTEPNLDIKVVENRDLVAVFIEKETVEPVDPEEDDPVNPEDGTREYKVNFDSNGGILDIRLIETVDGKLPYLPIPMRRGYIFTGWFTGNGIKWNENNPVTENMTLIAGWRNQDIPEKPIEPVVPAPSYGDRELPNWLIFGGISSSTTYTEPHAPSDNKPIHDEPIIEDKPIIEMNKFVDVPKTAFFKEAVDWAVENGITTGTTESTFSPYESTTRAETVTFLWRAAGMPEPTITESPFTDISKDEYYYKAVLWAYENGITTGVTASEFAPGEIVTRGEAVTFQWRVDGKMTVGNNKFKDVKSTAYYEKAVAWASEEGITVGTSENTFEPNRNVTRGEIVTFLYRQLGK